MDVHFRWWTILSGAAFCQLTPPNCCQPSDHSPSFVLLVPVLSVPHRVARVCSYTLEKAPLLWWCHRRLNSDTHKDHQNGSIRGCWNHGPVVTGLEIQRTSTREQRCAHQSRNLPESDCSSWDMIRPSGELASSRQRTGGSLNSLCLQTGKYKFE